MPGTYININSTTDKIVDTQKVTTGYFSNGSGKIFGTGIHSASVSDTNETYYYGITNSTDSDATTQFTVTYGHYAGSGSNTDADDIRGATQAIYNQWASTLLAENEITGGFKISMQGSGDGEGKNATTFDEDITVLVARRSLYKERFNKGNWTIALSGSKGAAERLMTLTDDSKTTNGVATPAGLRYNIVSGSDGNVATASTKRTFGWFYPEVGALVFSQQELSASIPGADTCRTGNAVYHGTPATPSTFDGFCPNLAKDADTKNALKFINCLRTGNSADTYIQARSEEDQTSVSYFCRVTANQMNFSNNPTFVSGSANEIRHNNLKGNPSVYITGVGLYNTAGQLVAISKLSTPLKKNFSSEATIKVKLTY